jgi:antitoxin component YwqK of YwqJK toxin-antitoxin module
MKKATIILCLLFLSIVESFGQVNLFGCKLYVKDCENDSLLSIKSKIEKNGEIEITCEGKMDTTFTIKYTAIKCNEKILKHGDYIAYVNGRKTFQALFIHDLLTSISFYYPDETLTYTIKNSKLNGYFQSYYNGYNVDHLKAYGEYKDNAKIGIWQSHYPSGIKKDSGLYSGDYVRIVYDTNLKCAIFFNNFCNEIRRECNPKSLRDILMKVYHLDLNEMSFPLIISKKIGIWKYYDEIGHLKESIDYNTQKGYVFD